MNKPTSYKEITKEWLASEASVADVNNMVVEEIKKVSTDWEQKVNERETATQEAKTKADELQKQYDELKGQFDELKKNFDSLSDKDKEREDQDKLNTRVASLDDVYELTDEDRKTIMEAIAGLSDDEYTKYEQQLKVFFKDRDKEAIAKKKEEDEKQKSQASSDSDSDNADDLLTKALANSKKDEKQVGSTTKVGDTDVMEELRDAFSPDKILR